MCKIKIPFRIILKLHYFKYNFLISLSTTTTLRRTSSGGLGWGTALQAARLQVQFLMVSLEFFIDITLWPHFGPGVNSASNKNEYWEYFLGVKAAGA